MDKYHEFFINRLDILIYLKSFNLYNTKEIQYFINNNYDLELRADIKLYQIEIGINNKDIIKSELYFFQKRYLQLKNKCIELNINYGNIGLIDPILKITQ